MSQVFVDSSFWIAFRGKNQEGHIRAVATARQLISARAQFVTTYLTFAEIHAAFSRVEMLRDQIIEDFTSNSVARIESPDPGDYAGAFALLRQHDDKSFSFCDAVSFAVMRRLNIKSALSLDDHFRQFGDFEILS